MNTASSIRYTVRPDTSPETELNALAAVYKYVIAVRREATRPGGPKDAERRSSEIGAAEKYTG